MKFEITLNNEQIAKIEELLEFVKDHPATGLTTIGQIVEKAVEKGIKDIDYRTRRNIREYKSNKEFKALNK